MSTRESGKKKFPKPRGWSVGWVFPQETATAAAEQAEEKENGTGKKMREPRSWAMRWDGSALSGIQKRRNEQGDESSER